MHEATAPPPAATFAMRPRERPASALASINVRFFANCEVAARGALAAMLASVLHVLAPHDLVVLIVAVSILCEV